MTVTAYDDLAEQWAAELRVDAANERATDPRDQSWMTSNPDALGLPLTWADSYSDLKAPDTVIGGLIEAGTLALMFGESNTGKSTFALDMALACARGVPWRGRRTRKGFVLWLALEGSRGVRQRVAAYRRRHTITESLAFADVSQSVCLLDEEHIATLIDTVRITETVRGERCSLVVVDTLARALCAGDENDGREMGGLIRGCDLLRSATDVAVLLIHHSGKDATRGARGHSSLRAAVDTEIEVSGRANPRLAKVSKQRDLPSGDVFPFDLEAIELGKDPETFDTIASVVVVHRDEIPEAPKRAGGKNQRELLAAIRGWQSGGKAIITRQELHDLAKGLGMKRWDARDDAIAGLESRQLLTPAVGGFRVSE